MITIISGTNRKGATTTLIAKQIVRIFKSKSSEKVSLIDLAELNFTLLPHQYNEEEQSPELKNLQDNVISPSEKLVFVLPEYNGSYPGIVKLFFDAISIRNYSTTFTNKKALLIGISSGRAGNLRGLDHFGLVLQHFGVNTFPTKFPFGQITSYMNDGEIVEDNTLESLEKAIASFIEF